MSECGSELERIKVPRLPTICARKGKKRDSHFRASYQFVIVCTSVTREERGRVIDLRRSRSTEHLYLHVLSKFLCKNRGSMMWACKRYNARVCLAFSWVLFIHAQVISLNFCKSLIFPSKNNINQRCNIILLVRSTILTESFSLIKPSNRIFFS